VPSNKAGQFIAKRILSPTRRCVRSLERNLAAADFKGFVATVSALVADILLNQKTVSRIGPR